MYSTLTIRNFRCFKELEVEGLRQVNLVTGLNNVGKTSFLEALFLLLGGFNPTLPLRVNALRGLERIIPNSEEQWGWLFYGHDTNQTIEIAGTGISAGSDSLRVHLGSRKEFELLSKGEREFFANLSGASVGTISPVGIPSTSVGVELSDLILEFKDHRGKTVISRVTIGGDAKLKIEQPKQNGFPPGAFLATRVRPMSEDADRLSRLKRQKRDGQVVEALKALEPGLKDLTILVLGGESVVHAEITGLGLIPIPMLGEGLGRLLSLSLAVLTTQGGVVLIDEIENGIHHSALERIWEGLARAVAQAEAQLIATSHSKECFEAAHAAFSKRETYEFSVVQLFRLPEKIGGRVLNHKHIKAAIAGEIDVR